MGFCLGTTNIKHPNYVIPSLIQKVKGADNIRQIRPIALINEMFKLTAEAFATRLASVAHKVISRSETTIIKGRFSP